MGRVYDLSTLVDAVLQLLAAGHALRLDLIGTGEQRGGLEAKVAAAGQEDAITFHGYLQGAALESVLVQSDLGVVPMYPESAVAVPYKACDYLAAGMPVINSLPGELMEMLEATGSGQFYTAGDTASMDRALTVWLKDRDALAAAQVAARRLFAEQLDADKIDPAYAEWVAAFGHNGEG
jgi:glycosyltransferase involved in cell wall biosynthesis